MEFNFAKTIGILLILLGIGQARTDTIIAVALIIIGAFIIWKG